MGFNAINQDADVFYRGVVSNGGARSARGFRTVKDPPGTDGFVHPFKLPVTPELPTILQTVISYGVETGGGSVNVPTYQPPTLSIVASLTSGEAGSSADLIVTPAWTQRDAGATNKYRVSVDSNVVHTAASPAAQTITGFQFSDAAQQIRGHVDYAAGPVKNDSNGDPYPAGVITAGTVSSNIMGITGFRRAFFACFNSQVITPTASTEVREYADSITNVSVTKQIVIDVPAGTHDVIFAFPASVGGSIDVRQQSFSGFDISAAFTKSIVPVEGANGYTAVPYNIYHMTNAAPYSADKLTVTISN